jgi:phosphopantetheinyl transferase (holo-ACP synthase)
VSEDGHRPGPDLDRREVDGRVEVVAVLDVRDRSPSLEPGAAAREAARAALLCALDLDRSNERMAEVEVRGGQGEPPMLAVHGQVAAHLGGRGAHVSLTHEGTVAAALVVVSGSAVELPGSSDRR